MADTVSQYVAWSDNANEYSQDQVDKVKPDALEDIDDLIQNVENRDPDLWDSFDIDAEQVSSDYDNEPIEDRGLEWVNGLSAISAAAGIQFFLDNREELIIKPSAYRAQVLAPFDLNGAQLVQAAKRDVARVTIERYQAIQAQYIKEFSFLRGIPNEQLYAELKNINALQSFDKYAADASGYVSRMTNHPPGSPQHKEALADLVNAQSTGAQQRMNRRSLEGLSVERQIQGDEDLLMVWALDPTSSHCSYCPDRAGEVRSYREWLDYGLPGAGVCRGGDRCNCHLVVI